MHKILTKEQRVEFEKKVRQVKYSNEKDRLCTILSYDEGEEIEDISSFLRISKATVYRYLSDYTKKHKIEDDIRGGADSKLSDEQTHLLKAHLLVHTYLYAKQICQYVFTNYQVVYTIVGMTKWLKRNGFVYKKPKLVPGKLETQKQEAFIQYYEELKKNLSADETIMFMDAVHPEHQSQPVSGWIKKGEIKTLSTTNKQFRLHLNGAIELSTLTTFIEEYETINAASIISFLKQLEEKNPQKTIHIICDNGRANKNKALKEYLSQTTRIKIHYLPPYSPNLNIIERLWKIMRERITYNKYYETFSEFSTAVRHFFKDKIAQIPDILKARLNDVFEAIRHNPVSLSS
jgi:transposase